MVGDATNVRQSMDKWKMLKNAAQNKIGRKQNDKEEVL
jgi:hypothetical protein